MKWNEIVLDTAVVNTIIVGSDHRLVRVRIQINTEKERRSLISRHRRTEHRIWTNIEIEQIDNESILEVLNTELTNTILTVTAEITHNNKNKTVQKLIK